MSLAWSFGATLHTGGRVQFSEFLIQEALKIIGNNDLLSFGEELIKGHMIDEDADLFSYFYDHSREKWLRWDHDIENFNIFGSQGEKNTGDDD